MKLKKCMKRISAVLLAATVIVSVLPNQPKVYAEEFPAEILFPINILDFRADNLIFEYPSSGDGNSFASLGTGNLKDLVENNLESDPNSIYYGFPVYKQYTVQKTAEKVRYQLEHNQNSTINVFNNWRYNGQINHLSMRNYIRLDDWVVLDAEDTGKYKTDYDNANYGGINHCSILGGSAEVVGGKNCLQEGYVSGIGGSGNGTVTFKYNNKFGKGNYTIKFFAMTNQDNARYKVTVGANSYNVNITNNHSLDTPPENSSGTLYNVPLVAGENTIEISAYSGRPTPNLDRITISGKTSNVRAPLGDYNESKAKYNIDRINNITGAEEPDGISDYGWYDIETCYDYAYFVLAHMFKLHPTLNKPYGDYNNLIFHKVDSGSAFPYYEFMGDANHKTDDAGLIFNPGNKSIRNGRQSEVNTAESEFRTQAGQMFIVDRMDKDYPVDAKYKEHNFHYTVRTHSRFVYKKGSQQTFFFNGDDDVYVFVNGQLVLDLGGAHTQQNMSVNLDTLSASRPDLDLKNGKAVDFDFYYCERHTTESNFYAKMNFKLASDVVSLEWPEEIKNMDYETLTIPYGYVVDLNYKFESNRELTTNVNLVFSDDFGDEIGVNGFKLGTGVRLRDDKKLIVTVKKDGVADPEVKEFTFANTTSITDAESQKVADLFKTFQLQQGDSVTVDGVIYDTSLKSFDSYNTTEDPRVRSMSFETKADYDMHMTMGGINSIDDTVAIHNHITEGRTVNMLMGKLVVSCKIEGLGENIDARKDLSAYGKFTLSRPETIDDDSTPEDERIYYQNQMDLAKGDNTIVFDSVIPTPPAAHTIYEKALPRGRYKLNMDTTVLTGYDLSVEIKVTKPDGNVLDVEVKKGDSQTVDGQTYTFDSLFLDIEPINVSNQWAYPTVEYILKAVRKVNPLKDLT